MGDDKLYDVPHDLKCCECESKLYLAEIHCPDCGVRPALVLKTRRHHNNKGRRHMVRRLRRDKKKLIDNNSQ